MLKELRYIKDIFIENKGKYIIGILCLIVVDTLQLILPWIFGKITDIITLGKLTSTDIIKYPILIALIAIGIAVFRFFWRYLVFGVSKQMEAIFRNRLYEHLQKLSINYYNNHKTGDIMAHATNDLNNVTTAAGQGIVLAIDSALVPIAAIILMVTTVGWKLSVASFLPMVALGVILALFVKQIQPRVEKMQEAFSNMTETCRENFSGIRVIKSYTQEIKEISKFEKANRNNRNMNMKFVRLMSMLFPVVASISALSFAIALWYGGNMVISKEISLGDFVAFNGFLGMLIWPIAALGWVVSLLQKGMVSLKRINVIMDHKPEIFDGDNVKDITKIEGNIEFRNLNFTYPGTERPVLEDINIDITAGKTLAIVGRTGSGKTTLINLITHLYNIESNSLFIDGNDINDIPLDTLRKNIGFVPQDTFLFSSTIKGNIDFFSGKSDEEIYDAAKSASIYENIMEFPAKFETVVGERGVTLSGGQKQRVAIARALLRMPSILILDDCLSAVDTQTEERILGELRKIMKQRTSIIVSHRISTVKEADEIIFLKDGRIVERGTHQTLLDLRGDYYEMHKKQLLAEQLEKEGAE